MEITSFLLKQNIPFVGIEITEPTLEDVFLRLTQNGQGGSRMNIFNNSTSEYKNGDSTIPLPSLLRYYSLFFG